MNMKILTLLLCMVTFHRHILGAKILAIFPHIYYSHFKETSKLVTQLASNGHDITFISPYPEHVKGYENITEISINAIVEPIKEFRNEFFKNDNYWNCYWSKLKYVKEIGYQYSKQILENENVTKLIKSNSSFDLVIMEDVSADGLAVLSYVFECPLVVLLSEPLSLFYENYMSDNILWKKSNDLRNAHHWVLQELYREWIILPSQNKIVKTVLPEAPDLRHILYQTSVVLMPNFQTLGNLVPKYPNVKQIGGFGIGYSREEPSKFKTFLDNSNQGVIIVSSNVPRDVEEKLKSFFYVHQEILQYIILFTSDVSEVIGHHNVKLFIGDGDVYDISQAILNRVPILSISNNRWQQQFLINSLVERDLVPQVNVNDLDSELFQEVMRDLLRNNFWYKEYLREISQIIRSNATPPMDQAMFWIEHVLKFDGAPQLRTSQLQWTIQNHLIEIIIVLSLIDIALFLLFYWIIKHFPKVLRYCGRKIIGALYKSKVSYAHKSKISYAHL